MCVLLYEYQSQRTYVQLCCVMCETSYPWPGTRAMWSKDDVIGIQTKLAALEGDEVAAKRFMDDLKKFTDERMIVCQTL